MSKYCNNDWKSQKGNKWDGQHTLLKKLHHANWKCRVNTAIKIIWW
jgi:hypothetical protein